MTPRLSLADPSSPPTRRTTSIVGARAGSLWPRCSPEPGELAEVERIAEEVLSIHEQKGDVSGRAWARRRLEDPGAPYV